MTRLLRTILAGFLLAAFSLGCGKDDNSSTLPENIPPPPKDKPFGAKPGGGGPGGKLDQNQAPPR